MRVLYVNHTAIISGAERSLLSLLTELPKHGVTAQVAAPRGDLAQEVQAMGIPVARLPATAGSLKLHPWHTPLAVAEMLAAALAVYLHARRSGAQLLHANSIRSGVITGVATRLGGPPSLVHVRDCLPESRASRVVRSLVDRMATSIVANSRYSAECWAPARAGHGIHVVGNGVDLKRFDPTLESREVARQRLGLGPSGPVLVIVGQITQWKGQELAIEVLRRVRQPFPTARLLIVGTTKFVSGATRYDNRAYLSSLRTLVERLALNDGVEFLGERDDVPRLFRAADIALLPSWEEPFGRSAVEAMAMGVPVIATEVGGPREFITHGVNGYLAPPRRPECWAQVIADVLSQPETAARVGLAGQRTATERFDSARNAEEILQIYATMLDESRSRP